MTTSRSKRPELPPQDALGGYRSAVGALHQKLALIAAHNHQTCSHLSRAAIALRSMARGKAK